MANFIPNFNAPSQNYGNILNMSYRRGMDPRKRRRIASGRPAGTQVITNPDGTQVSVSGQTARQASNAARRESRAKRVSEVAAGQKRTKPSDILMSPAEQKSRQMTRARSLADRFYEKSTSLEEQGLGGQTPATFGSDPYAQMRERTDFLPSKQQQTYRGQTVRPPNIAFEDLSQRTIERLFTPEEQRMAFDPRRSMEYSDAMARSGITVDETGRVISMPATRRWGAQGTSGISSPTVVPYTLYELLKRMG